MSLTRYRYNLRITSWSTHLCTSVELNAAPVSTATSCADTSTERQNFLPIVGNQHGWKRERSLFAGVNTRYVICNSDLLA
jgi:hypothetical protein